MLSKEENSYLTRTGPDTPMGTLFRRFWLPLFLSSELPDNDGPPLRTRILGEDLSATATATGTLACWTPTVRIAGRRSSTDATKSAACAASTTAGSSTLKERVSICRPSRPTAISRIA